MERRECDEEATATTVVAAAAWPLLVDARGATAPFAFTAITVAVDDELGPSGSGEVACPFAAALTDDEAAGAGLVAMAVGDGLSDDEPTCTTVVLAAGCGEAIFRL